MTLINPAARLRDDLQANLRGPSSEVRRSTFIRLANVGRRFLRLLDCAATLQGRMTLQFFARHVEYEEFDGRLCECAEGWHRAGEACLLEGTPV